VGLSKVSCGQRPGDVPRELRGAIPAHETDRERAGDGVGSGSGRARARVCVCAAGAGRAYCEWVVGGGVGGWDDWKHKERGCEVGWITCLALPSEVD